MKTIRKMIKQYSENKNVIPYKTIKLSTGVICEHYKNGKINVVC